MAFVSGMGWLGGGTEEVAVGPGAVAVVIWVGAEVKGPGGADEAEEVKQNAASGTGPGGIGMVSGEVSAAGCCCGGGWDALSSVGTGLSGAGSDMPRAARSSASNCAVSAILDRMGLRGPLSCIKRDGCWSSRGGNNSTCRDSSRARKRQRQRQLGAGVRGDQRDDQWCLRFRKMTAVMVVTAQSSMLDRRFWFRRPGLRRFNVIEEISGRSVPTVFVSFFAGLHSATASIGRGLSGSGIEAPGAARFASEMFRCDSHSRRPKHDPR